jgi:hypothetical protein
VVVLEVRGQDPQQVSLIQDNEVIQALAPDRTDEAFNVRRLPRRAISDNVLFDAHMPDTSNKIYAVDSITISNEKARRLVEWKCVYYLLRCPPGCWMRGDVEVDNSSSVMAKYDEAVEYLEGHGWNGEEVDCGDLTDVILKETEPGR